MRKRYVLACWGMMFIVSSSVMADDARLFRTVPTDTPRFGVIRASNSTFYSRIDVNNVLVNNYGVQSARVLTSATDVEIGLPKGLAITGTIPYYADMFSQNKNRGFKGGVGDIAVGLRFSRQGKGSGDDRFAAGVRFLIPEKLGFGTEPLAFRTFSTGQSGCALEMGGMRRAGFADLRFSASVIRFPGAPKPGAVSSKEVFYDTGFGYRGIGAPDSTGFATTLFLNQIQIAGGAEIPLHPGVSGLVEMHANVFTARPGRETILRITPGLRIGKPEGISAAAGIDISLRGSVPNTSFVFRVAIPSLSPKDIGRGLGIVGKAPAERQIRARNALVVIPVFSGISGIPVDNRDLRNAFQAALGSMHIFNVIPATNVDRVLRQESLAPVQDSPEALGVRLGAQYLIKTEIISYRSVRSSRFSVPFLLRFPSTNLTLSARAWVTDLANGREYDLGVISSTVVKNRGYLLFPIDSAVDISRLSEPETRMLQRDLADSWVEAFSARVLERMEIFDWNPKRAEETSGHTGG